MFSNDLLSTKYFQCGPQYQIWSRQNHPRFHWLPFPNQECGLVVAIATMKSKTHFQNYFRSNREVNKFIVVVFLLTLVMANWGSTWVNTHLTQLDNTIWMLQHNKVYTIVTQGHYIMMMSWESSHTPWTTPHKSLTDGITSTLHGLLHWLFFLI